MVTGKIKKEPTLISADDIFSMTSGGYDLYMYYIGKVSHIMQRPWGKKERKLSWGAFCRGGIWFWKDHATEESGNAIQMVMKMFNLSFEDACNKIIWDFNLKPNAFEVKSSVITWDEPSEDEKQYVRMNFTSKPFTKFHHEFWDGTEVTEAHCNRYNTWAVKDLAIKGRRFKLRENEVVFAYYAPEEDACKIYFPQRGEDPFNPKFRNNTSGSYLWNYENLLEKCGEKCDKGILQKSMKDLLVTAVLTPHVIAGNNEQSKLFTSQHTVEKVHRLFNQVWVSFGSDPDGKEKSIKITQHNGWNWVNPKNELLPDINDFYSLAKGKGIGAVEELLKEKKFL